MKFYLDGKEVSLDELKIALNNLEICGYDGGDFEVISLEEIDEDGNLHFETNGFSTY